MFECLLFGLARSLSISLSKFLLYYWFWIAKSRGSEHTDRYNIYIYINMYVSKERMHVTVICNYDQFGQRWHISAVFLWGRMRIIFVWACFQHLECAPEIWHSWHSLWKWAKPQKERIIFQPSFFRGNLLNFRGVTDMLFRSIKNFMGPNPNGPRSVSC